MKRNNSPGLEGIPAEFYKSFWSSLDRQFNDALKEIYICYYTYTLKGHIGLSYLACVFFMTKPFRWHHTF